jgi:PhoPQ-activated pathogenicity-related protein
MLCIYRFAMHARGLFVCLVFSSAAFATALDDYVVASDANYSYTKTSSSFDINTFTTGYVLRLTSQGWRNISEVDHVIWQHRVTVIVPSSLLGSTYDTALIYISGGNNSDPAPTIDPNLRLLSAGTRSVIVVLTAVPNQPLQFADETASRSEDEIIAYSWDKFLRGGDDYWPVQLPMVKSVVRCMDAVKAFVGSSAGGSKTINHFVLTGGSKRGWTAWLTAAVDSRVTAVAPIVSDLLNMKRSFAHHWAAYGFWAEALQPYVDMGIFDWFDTPESTALLAIVDPYEYRSRLTMPKFIINAAGDDFFVSDSVQFYIHALPGETYLRHVPNTNHYLDNAFTTVFNGMAPYYDAFLKGNARPNFSWSVQPDGSIYVTTVDAPKAVNLWRASNPTTRDFRQVTIGITWTSQPLSNQGGGVYIGQVPQPESGWTAFFVELIYGNSFATDHGAEYDYHFTTEMMVVPELLPFEADLNRDRLTDLLDVVIFSEAWLTDNSYRDLWPRRGGDGIVDFKDFGILDTHWMEEDNQ